MAAQYSDGELSYPPYNIEQADDDHYRVTTAVAGFKPADIKVVLTENTLTIKSAPEAEDKSNLIYKGIARRAFEKRFQLADHVRFKMPIWRMAF